MLEERERRGRVPAADADAVGHERRRQGVEPAELLAIELQIIGEICRAASPANSLSATGPINRTGFLTPASRRAWASWDLTTAKPSISRVGSSRRATVVTPKP